MSRTLHKIEIANGILKFISNFAKNPLIKFIICFVGTDSKCLKDHVANLKMGFGKASRQMVLAKKFAKSANNMVLTLTLIKKYIIILD